MSFMKYQIKMLEPFKDGNILEGRQLKAGEVLEVTESEKNQIWQSSGGMIEVLQMVVPNPRKLEAERLNAPVELAVLPEEQAIAEPVKPVVEDTPKGRKAKHARK